MFEFELIFSRYDGKRGQRRQSAPVFVPAAGFDAAVLRANDMLRGMANADQARDYKLASVAQRGLSGEHGYSAGADMFETQEEFSARLAEREGGAS
jgi:hypothetical protein